MIRGGSLLLSAFVDPKGGTACRRFRAEKRLESRCKPPYSQFRGIGPIHTFSTNEDQTFRIRVVEFGCQAEGEFRRIQVGRL